MEALLKEKKKKENSKNGSLWWIHANRI